MKFIIYTRDNCSYCTAAKMLLDSKGFKYSELIMTLEKAKEIKTRIVPQIFLDDGTHIGGFQDLIGFLS